MNEIKVKYRLWMENDFYQIINILEKSWDAAYSSFIPKEDLDFYLQKTYSYEKLKELLQNSDIIGYAAEVEKSCAGWLKLTINNNENRFYISSIYVHPEYQGLQIGKSLMNIAYSTAIEKGFNEIWIGVMEQNIKALEWYKKIGFEFNESLPFSMGRTSINHFIGVKKLH